MVTSPRASDDQRFLDELFDRILHAWEEGRELPVADLVAARPDLQDAIEETLAVAREIALVRPRALPRVPGYRILRELGRGGMGVVFLARQENLDREVALKILPAASRLPGLARHRLLAEARALARLRHPSLVTVFEVIDAGELCAYAMEWVRGSTLAQELAKGEIADPVRCCRMAIQIARALAAAHGHGLVHRDVKPSNILLGENGEAKLSDFGLVHDDAAATLTRSGAFVGTPSYAAPEQLRGDRGAVGAATDVYALGATLFHALVGHPPFEPGSVLERLRAAEKAPRLRAARRDLAMDLDTIVGKCLEFDAGRRYESADALADDLERLLALRPIRARRPRALARAMKFVQRHRRAVGVAAVSAAGVAVCAGALGWSLWRAAERPARVAAHVRAARIALLEPSHEARALAHLRGEPRQMTTRFGELAAAALADYDAALALDPDDAPLRLERAVVASARAVVAKHPVDALPPALADRYPGTCAVLAAVSAGRDPVAALSKNAAAEDAFAAGLLGYVVGDVALSEAAWRSLAAAPSEGATAFVDAALGQTQLARGRCDWAWPRLALARRAYPEVGFLAVAVADCAAQLGDVEAAQRALAASRGLSLPDPFNGADRVEADLLALGGEYERAFALYDWILLRRRGEAVRSRWAEMLARRGRGEDQLVALDLLAWLVEHETTVPWYAWRLAERVDAWCEVASDAAVADALLGPLCMADTKSHWITQAMAAFDRHGGRPEDTAAATWPPVRGGRGTLVRALSHPSSALRSLLEGLGADTMARTGLPRWAKYWAIAVCLHLDRGAAARDQAWPALLANFVVVPVLRAWGGLAQRWASRGEPRWTWRGPVRTAASLPPMRAALQVPGLGTVLYGSRSGSARLVVVDEREAKDLTVLPWMGSPGLVLDPELGMLAIGSVDGGSQVQVWSWAGGAWCVLPGAGAPPPRFSPLVVFDEARHRVVLYGGHRPQAGRQPRFLADTWEWDRQSWRQVESRSAPSARYGAALAYDRTRRCVLLFGGGDFRGDLCDTWTFDGAQWRQERPTMRPPGRAYAALGQLAGQDRILLWSGRNHYDPDAPPQEYNDLWEWDGKTWEPASIAASSPRPPPTAYAFAFEIAPSTLRWFGCPTGKTVYAWDLVQATR